VNETLVTFPSGAMTGDATVTAVRPHPDGAVVVLDTTPFHPVDHTWPDQPGDIGTLISAGEEARVIDTVMAATENGTDLLIGTDIPVKRGTDGWTWLVAHVIGAGSSLAEGSAVHALVDAGRRLDLSRGHTACHLASLALDAALADLWHKEVRPDPLRNPDFEGRANESSFIHANGSVDRYRLGKSLRKAGFDSETLAATLAEREQRANAQLAAWVAAGSASRIETAGPGITDMRTWHCTLPEGEATFPCGGTHVASLADFRSITVQLAQPDAQTLVMTTTATAV
jgi:alanyl-tRNA synthetase